jgi:hypothetical protein
MIQKQTKLKAPRYGSRHMLLARRGARATGRSASELLAWLGSLRFSFRP